MKQRFLDPNYQIHPEDPVRVEVAGKSYRVFPVTNHDTHPVIFCRTLKEARHLIASDRLPDLLHKIMNECGQDLAPDKQLKKISDMCFEALQELHKSYHSSAYATCNESVHQIQQARIETAKEERRAFKKGATW